MSIKLLSLFHAFGESDSKILGSVEIINSQLIGTGACLPDFVLTNAMLEHMVDTVISLEGDRRQMFRLLRVLKNRFGPNQELLVFQMVRQGLEVVEDPATYFLGARDASLSGTAVVMAVDGQRPLAVEVQALVTRSYLSIPRRPGLGFDVNRLHLILAVLEKAGRYLLTIRITDLLDIAIMAYLVYKLLSLVKSTRAANILKGVAIFLAALWLSSALELRSVNYLLSHMVSVGVLALMILFQPELRQILEQIGSKNIRLLRVFAPEQQVSEMEQAIDQTVMACTEMSKSRTGVLIVFERKILLNDMVRSGTTLDASVSSELLKNIFFVKAPMHDGAVIIRRGRILGAGCMLPLSKNVNLSRDLGMRHRAGIGMSENSDAVVVIVSEETGSISVAIGGMLKRHLTSETLSKLLCNELMPAPEEEEKNRRAPLLELLRGRRKEGDEQHGA